MGGWVDGRISRGMDVEDGWVGASLIVWVVVAWWWRDAELKNNFFQ